MGNCLDENGGRDLGEKFEQDLGKNGGRRSTNLLLGILDIGHLREDGDLGEKLGGGRS